MEPMDLLADTRRYLASAIKQREAINAGAPIAEPVTREQAINIVTEQIGLFESVLRRYGGRETVTLKQGQGTMLFGGGNPSGRPPGRHAG
jgi:hypothetical protein